jgi:Tfp pilus assembly protein PilZ
MWEEKRKSIRHPVCVNIDTLPDPIPIGRLMNISTDGLFIQATNLKEVGTKIDLCFTLPISSRKIKATAEVIWVHYLPSFDEEYAYSKPDRYIYRGPGMGVRFISISPEDKVLIEQFIQQGTT